MKRIITILIMTCCISIAAMAQNGPDQYVDFQIVAQGHIETPIYRAPSFIPVQGYYSSSPSMLFLDFAYNIGTVIVRIENTTTGDFLLESIPTNSGMQLIATSLDTGVYIIWISTSGGSQFYSELQI